MYTIALQYWLCFVRKRSEDRNESLTRGVNVRHETELQRVVFFLSLAAIFFGEHDEPFYLSSFDKGKQRDWTLQSSHRAIPILRIQRALQCYEAELIGGIRKRDTRR